MMKNKKRLLPAAALAAVALLMLGLWRFTRPQTQPGDKTIVIEVVHSDRSAREFTYQTDAEFLGQVLLEEALASGEDGAYGLFITTVDGETINADQNQWWCVTKRGQMVDTGVDATPIADGDQFELTLSTY